MPDPKKDTDGTVESKPKGDGGEVKAPDTVTLKTRAGESIQMPAARVTELAEAALTLETDRADLEVREAALRSDTRRYGDYEKLRDVVDADPTTTQAFQHAVRNPGEVVRRMTGGETEGAGGGSGDLGGDDPATTRIAADLSVEDLRQTVQAQGAELAAIKARNDASAGRTAVHDELLQYPWLKDESGGLNKKGELARRDVLARYSQSQGGNLTQIAALAATDVKGAMEEERAAAVVTTKEREKLATVDTTKGLGVASPDKPYTKKDLGTGRLVEDGLAIAAKMGLTD